MLSKIALAVATGAIITAAPFKVFADDASWNRTIEKVSKTQQLYWDFANARQSFGAATGLNGIDARKHECAIIGRMLGLINEIKEAEYMEVPPLTFEVEAYVQYEYARSLEEWVAAANRAVAMSKTQRITVWNLQCPGRYGIPDNSLAGAGEMKGEFEVTENGGLMVYGDIDKGFYQRFIGILESNPQIKKVWLGSGGGSIKDAVLAGIQVRQRNLETQLFSSCVSACPILFAGGVDRTIYPEQNDLTVSIGFHQISSDGVAIPLDSSAYDDVAKYLTLMGTDGQEVVSWMRSAKPDEMFTPQPQALCAIGLATFVYHVCSAPY